MSQFYLGAINKATNEYENIFTYKSQTNINA